MNSQIYLKRQKSYYYYYYLTRALQLHVVSSLRTLMGGILDRAQTYSPLCLS